MRQQQSTQRIAALDAARLGWPNSRGDGWVVNQWLKKAVSPALPLEVDGIGDFGGPGGAHWWDKVPSKFAGWGDKEFAAAGFRAAPGCDRPALGLHRPGAS